MKVLVTGFEPFGKFSINSSERAVAQLPKSLGGNEIVTLILPVSYTRVEKLLTDCLQNVRPDAVVCVGQNASSSEIRVESTAGNYAHSEEEDGDHNLWLYRSIDMSGAPSYRSTLPIEEIVRNIKNAGIAADISHSAGTFVCNCLMYHALRACETDFAGTLCGLIHVPALPEQSGESGQQGMPLEKITEALKIAIGTVINPDGDGVIAEDAVADNPAETASDSDVPAADTRDDNAGAAADGAAADDADDDDDDEFSMAAGVTPEMLAAINDDDDDMDEPAGETAPEATGSEAGTGSGDTDRGFSGIEGSLDDSSKVSPTDGAQTAGSGESSDTASGEESGKTKSAASAAVAYFSKTKKDKVRLEREDIAESEVYYGGRKKPVQQPGTKTEEVLKRISGSVPERASSTAEEPRETLFDPARERAVIDTKDYRVFSVDSKYRGASDALDQMTLTEFMEEFIPEREKTEKELREEQERTLIHEDDVRDPRTFNERMALRREAARKEDEKEHVAFGDLFVMSETMRAMGKTINKSVLVDDDIHMLLYTALEDGGDIWAYHIVELDGKSKQTKRIIGEFPLYASKYEKYYLFCALTDNKKIVCDPETYEIRLEEL